MNDFSSQFLKLKKQLAHPEGKQLTDLLASLRPDFVRVWRDIFLGYAMVGIALYLISAMTKTSLLLGIVMSLPTAAWIGFWLAYLHLFLHEAAHFNISPSRKWNDLLSNLFIGWIVFQPIKSYRSTHWEHHRNFSSDKDPESSYQNSLNLRFGLATLTGVHAIRTILVRRGRSQGATDRKTNLLSTLLLFLALNLLVYGSVLAFLSPASIIVLFLGQFSFMPFWGALRQLLEHKAQPDSLAGVTRQFNGGYFAKYFGAAGFNNHLIHHWEPSVSYTNLDEVRSFLADTAAGPILESRSTTYCKTLRDLWLR